LSYDICYDRCFIRSGMGITPMWLVGSNNCTESIWGLDGKCHERRERHWSPLCNMAGVSEEELMEKAYSYVPTTYNQHFMRGGKWVDDAGWIRFVENGIKNAVSIEDVLKYTHRSKMMCRLHTWVGDDSRYWLETYVSTTAEYDEWLRKAKELKESRNDEWGPWFCVDMGMREPIKIPAKKNLSGKVVAKYKNDYICSVDCHGIVRSPLIENAIIFDSLEKAKEVCEKQTVWQITYVDGSAIEKRKEWKWAIKATTGTYQGMYVERRTAHKVRMDYSSKYAKRFPTKAAAEKYIAELRPHYSTEFEAVEVKS